MQVRNPHNLLQDMAEETDLYAKAGDLVKLLRSWHAAPAKKLPELIIDLAQHMADTGFWEQVRPRVDYTHSTPQYSRQQSIATRGCWSVQQEMVQTCQCPERPLWAASGHLILEGHPAHALFSIQGDADLARAWVEDLTAIGYRFPKRQKRRAAEAAPALATVARTPTAWKRYPLMVLVINFNKPYDG